MAEIPSLLSWHSDCILQGYPNKPGEMNMQALAGRIGLAIFVTFSASACGGSILEQDVVIEASEQAVAGGPAYGSEPAAATPSSSSKGRCPRNFTALLTHKGTRLCRCLAPYVLIGSRQCELPAAPAICGNNKAEGGESCDGLDLKGETCKSLGFDTGTLSCSGSCTHDTSACAKTPPCGNGVVDPGEECDPAAATQQTCKSLGFQGGILGCDSCKLDTALCIDAPGLDAMCTDSSKPTSPQCLAWAQPWTAVNGCGANDALCQGGAWTCVAGTCVHAATCAGDGSTPLSEKKCNKAPAYPLYLQEFGVKLTCQEKGKGKYLCLPPNL
jgi:hypothetical protein